MINTQTTTTSDLQGPELTTNSIQPFMVQPLPSNSNWKPPTSPYSGVPTAFPEPPTGPGVNNWVFLAILWSQRNGLTEGEAERKARSYEPKLHRSLRQDEISRAISTVYRGTGRKTQTHGSQRVPRWPRVDVEAQRRAIESSTVKSVEDLKQHSDPVPAEGTANAVVDLLFPGDPLICVSGHPWDFGTHHRSDLEFLENAAQIVPSPMAKKEGMKADGLGTSEHTLANTGERKYLVAEFDGILNKDVQASLIWHLSQYAPLVCVCFSGNKSLHGWFRVEGCPEAEVLKFFRYAVTLGADSATWSKTQFCRLPGGLNYDKGTRQEVYYLKPGAGREQLLKMPGGFEWNLRSGSDMWTKDQDAIRNLSAKPVVDGLIRTGDVGSIVGASKTSKTWFALGLSLAVSNGSEFIGRRCWKQKTLYLDYELKETTLRKRMCMLAETKPNNFDYVSLRGVDPLPTFDQIEELVVSGGYEFIVLDSLYRTGLLTEENSNDSTSRELTRLQTFASRAGVTIFVVDHTAKGGGAERSAVDASRGASSKGGFFDFILVLRTHTKPVESMAKQVTLESVVRDWAQPDILPVLSFLWKDVSCKIQVVGEAPVDDPQLKCGRLLDILTEIGEQLTVANLSNRSGLPDTTVRKCLDRLVEQGKVQWSQDPGHSQRKLYRVAPEEGAEPPDRSS